MKILRLKVDNLYGLYDYSIDFNNGGEDLTVITSPNGYGKTTLLRIINSLHSSRLFYLYVLKYRALSFWFDNGCRLEAKEINSEVSSVEGIDLRKNQRRDLRLVWFLDEKELCRFDYQYDAIQKAKQTFFRNVSPPRHLGLEPLENNDGFFTNGDGGEFLNMELAQEQGQEQFMLQLATIQTDFIGANRIYNSISRKEFSTRRRPELPVLQVVCELKEMLLTRVNDFQNNFQRLDSKFIDMLLDGEGNDIGADNYNERASRLTAIMEELTSFGLTNKQSLPLYQQGKAKILDVYLTLMDEKLKYYKDLLPLVRLFDRNIAQKHFAQKTIKLSPQHGLRIEANNGELLSADMLSTGEQNQLVLLYDLVFKTPKGSILLIDEPENSLHVAWQNDFVSDMQTIALSKELQIVVATHSSIIVSNTPEDKVFDLFYYLQRNRYDR